MRSSNTFGIQFVIRLPKQQKNDQATVFARISVNGRRCEISLKKKVNPQNWDEAKGKARGTKDEIRKLNEHIEIPFLQVGSRILYQKAAVIAALEHKKGAKA